MQALITTHFTKNDHSLPQFIQNKILPFAFDFDRETNSARFLLSGGLLSTERETVKQPMKKGSFVPKKCTRVGWGWGGSCRGGMGWVKQGWGGSCRGRVGWVR